MYILVGHTENARNTTRGLLSLYLSHARYLVTRWTYGRVARLVRFVCLVVSCCMYKSRTSQQSHHHHHVNTHKD